MKYVLEANFIDKPKCSSCMVCSTKGLDLNGETVLACFGLGIRPKCPQEGCRKDCPLKAGSEDVIKALKEVRHNLLARMANEGVLVKRDNMLYDVEKLDNVLAWYEEE